VADQQFLASFGVDIDESGVSRLQKILAENRTLGDHLTAAFNAASESVKAFRESISEDFPTLFSGSGFGNVTESLFGDSAGLKIGLNMTEPKKEVAAFTADAKKPIPLTANASSIVSAARTAMEQVRSLFSETFILNVRANSNTDNRLSFQGSRPFSTEKEPLALSPGATNPPEPSSGNVYNAGSAFLKMSSGGRFSRPTSVQVAEDGDAEYIIPVKKENKALPLLRQLLSELSPSARASLEDWGTFRSPPIPPSAASLSTGTMTQNNQNVSAPVTINVNASGADANRIGQSIYDTAERYLLRTMKSAWANP